MKLAEFQQSCREYGHAFYIATSSTTNKIESFNAQTPLEFSFLFGDETNLKTIVRSNPGILLIVNGNIAGKWHYNDLPPVDGVKHPLSYAISKQQSNRAYLLIGAHALLLALSALLILFRKTHKHKKQ